MDRSGDFTLQPGVGGPFTRLTQERGHARQNCTGGTGEFRARRRTEFAVDPFWTEDDEDIEIEFRPISDEGFIEDVEAEEREKDQDL